MRNLDRTSKQVQRGLGGIEKAARNSARGLGAVKTAAVAVVAALAVNKIIDVTAAFEDLRTTLDSVTGSADSGGKAMDFINKFATRTQFGVEELGKTFIKLQANGIDPTTKLLTTFTDAAAVTTDQVGVLESMTDLYTRTLQSQMVELTDLDRLADRGLPVYDILAEKLGVSRSELSEFSKEAGNAQRVLDALQQGIAQRFGGATESRLQNLSTIMSNFGIATREAVNQFGTGLAPAIKEIVSGLTNFISSNGGLFRTLGELTGAGLSALADGFKELADGLGILDPGGLERVFGNFMVSLGEFLIGLDSGFNAIKTGFATTANVIMRTAAAVQSGVQVLEPGQSATSQIDAVKLKIEETQAAIEKFGFSQAGQGLQLRLGALQTQLEELEQGSTTFYTLFETQTTNATSVVTEFGEKLKDIGNAQIASADAQAAQAAAGNIVVKNYDDQILRIARLQAAEAARNDEVEKTLTFQQKVDALLAESMATADANIKSTRVNQEAIRQLGIQYREGGLSVSSYAEQLRILGHNMDHTVFSTVQFSDFMKDLNATVSSSLTNDAHKARALAQIEQQFADGLITGREYEAFLSALGKSTTKTTKELTALERALEGVTQTADEAAAASVSSAAAAIERFKDPIVAAEEAMDEAMAGLDIMRDKDLVSEADYLRTKERLVVEHNRKILDIQKEQDRKKAALRKADITADLGANNVILETYLGTDAIIQQSLDGQMSQLQGAASIFGNILNDLSGTNKKAFEAAKRYNIAVAIMNTILGITKALGSYPPPFNFLAAAAVGAAGYAQVSAIRSQQYSGRALGGPVMGGDSYLVGENGPEIFTPATSGRVTRNDQIGGGQPVEINFTINAIDSQGIDQVLVERRSVIQQIISDSMMEAGQRSRF
jgi:hypothetical protein